MAGCKALIAAARVRATARQLSLEIADREMVGYFRGIRASPGIRLILRVRATA